MDFQLSDDQRALRSGMRDLLGAVFDRDRLRGRGGAGRGLWTGRCGGSWARPGSRAAAAGGGGRGGPRAARGGAALRGGGPGAATGPAGRHTPGGGPGEGGRRGRGGGDGRGRGASGGTPGGGGRGAAGGGAEPLAGEALRAFVAAARPVRSMDPLTPLHRPPAASVRTRAVAERAPGRDGAHPGARRAVPLSRPHCSPPPSSSAARPGPPRRPFNTPGAASSSDLPSERSRRSNISAPTCSPAPNRPAPPCTRPP